MRFISDLLDKSIGIHTIAIEKKRPTYVVIW